MAWPNTTTVVKAGEVSALVSRHPTSQWKGLKIAGCVARSTMKLDQGNGQHDGMGHAFGYESLSRLRAEVMSVILATLNLCVGPS
jgi:hypothetical protein